MKKKTYIIISLYAEKALDKSKHNLWKKITFSTHRNKIKGNISHDQVGESVAYSTYMYSGKKKDNAFPVKLGT